MASNIAQIVGKRIRRYRTERKLTQEKLAELAGCHPTYVGQVERGEKNTTIETIEKIANALDVPLSQLFEMVGGKQSETLNQYILLFHEFIESKTEEEQKILFEIITEIEKYKNKNS